MYLSTKEEIVQRASLLLSDVEYVIEAHFEMTEKVNETDNPGSLRYYHEKVETGRMLPYAIFWMS